MSIGRTKARLLFLSLGLVSGVAVACTIIYGVSFDVMLPKIDARDVAGEVGGALEEQFGSRYGRDVEVSGVVRYTAEIPIIGIAGGLHSMPFTKPCGKTFQEEANERWPLSASIAGSGGGGGGMCGGGGLDSGVIGYRPIYRTATVAVEGGGTSSQTVLVGYEPIYGMVRGSKSISVGC